METNHKPLAIGIDLGGTNTVLGIADPQGNIIAQDTVKTQAHDNAHAFVEACMARLKPLVTQAGGLDQIAGMGIGAPNGNYLDGCISFAPNIAWAHDSKVPIAQMFSDRLGGLPVRLTNDANAAAMGEMVYGAAQGMKDFIVITLGTGVGSGIVANGRLICGHDGLAGELGHIVMVRGTEGRACGCGRSGCLETYCSATGVARTAHEILAATDRPSLLREKPADQIESLDVAIAAGKGDDVANEIFRFTGNILGQACADFSAFSSPEAFIFFGGLCRAGELIMRPIREAYDRSVMPIYRRKAKFLVSPLMDTNAAVLGAAALGRGE